MQHVTDISPDTYQYYELVLQDGQVLGRVGDSYPMSGDPIEPAHLVVCIETMIAESEIGHHESVRVVHENGEEALSYEECEALRC